MSDASPMHYGRRTGRRLQWLGRLGLDLLRHARANWYCYVPVLVIWALAFARLLVDPTPRLPILFNWTSSLPYTVALMQYGKKELLKAGDFIVYAFEGEAQRMYPGLRAQPLFKQIRGVPGDRITVIGREVFVNGVSAGIAKPRTFDGRPLEPIAEAVIPVGFYYVQGTHPNSFDSRYHASGLVAERQVIAKVRPLF
jgi:conjugal transfer pilin signal peptidase TrbI